jgi:hypothetical protein
MHLKMSSPKEASTYILFGEVESGGIKSKEASSRRGQPDGQVYIECRGQDGNYTRQKMPSPQRRAR